MSANRQDAWTKEEDQFLAHTVIDYIKNGRTQLESFKEVARQLNRTPAACGFRWNASIRKLYNEAIEEAKQLRKKYGHPIIEPESKKHDTFSLEQAIQWLEKVKGEFSEQSWGKKGSLYNKIVAENERLNNELITYQKLIAQIQQLIQEVKLNPND
ncbi:RsfA family transcriptional regulator [Amphibacillus jilinensis]|uniref:RsfA family transcriptional regulator n=1 Tax=Amphibacillus jilinensis TaxID=1216008 RepID=UPI00030EC02A|nr:RsfA family transcriptional regulator [Amphibacillus jilinensis]